MSSPSEHKPDPVNTSDRSGDPLEGLWHWTDRPTVRVGMALGILAGLVLGFIVLAQITF